MSLIKLGLPVGNRSGGSTDSSTDTVGGIVVQLKTSDQRQVRAATVIEAWREEMRPLPGLDNFTITAQQTGPPGRAIDIRLRGGSVHDLKRAANEVAELLGRYAGVSDVGDNLPLGKPEVVLELTARGRALGFTTGDVGRQVRNSIYGAVAKRFPRDDEEVWLRVQLDRRVVDTAMLRNLYLDC